MTLVLECTDERGTKKTFKTPDEAVQWYDKREKDGKPPVDFYLNGRRISVRKLKQIAGRSIEDGVEKEEE